MSRLRSFFRRRSSERELHDEIESNIQLDVDRRIAQGEHPDEARRQALVRFGSIAASQEAWRDQRAFPFIETFARDFRHALRTFRRRPAFTILAITAIAIGIGGNAAIFSVVKGVLLRPLPYANADRLVFIRADFRGESNLPGIAPGELDDIRNQSKLIESIGWMALRSASLTADQQMEHLTAAAVSDEFLPTLGVSPAVGRGLIAAEDGGSPRVRNVMISYALWQRRFQGDRNIIGRAVEVNNYPVSIVGVVPEGFRLYLGNDTNVPPEVDIWFPTGTGGRTNRTSHAYPTVARLAPGVTSGRAQAELDAMAVRMAEQYPAAYAGHDFRLRLSGLQQDIVKPVRPVILVLLCAVGFVLLISCANVANLLLARAQGRKGEMAIRTALGAGQASVIRQMLTESITLAVAGGVAGLLLARQGVALLLYLKPDNLPLQSHIALDTTVIAFAFGLSILCGILFGVAPALQAANVDVQSALHEAGRAKTSSAAGRRMRASLVAAQVALSLVLLVCAGLMIRTFENMRRVDLGFDPSNLLTLRVDYSPLSLRGAEVWRFYQRAVDAVKNVPGVESASGTNVIPFGTFLWTDSFALEQTPDVPRTAFFNSVLPGYFNAMRIPLRSGRDFTEKDNDEGAAVAIVDQRFAEKTWPGQDPIGRKLVVRRKPVEIIGVAGYTPFGIRPDERPQLYVPYDPDFNLMLVVRTKTDPTAIASLLRSTIEGLGGKRPVWDIRTMDDYISGALAETRFTLILIGVLSLVAFLLSVIGIYGVVSYSVTEQMREFAIRIAVGANPNDILKLAIGCGLRPAAAGLLIGLASALALTRFLTTLLFNVSPTDWLTYIIVAVFLLAAAFLASYIPVRSLALRADPRRFF